MQTTKDSSLNVDWTFGFSKDVIGCVQNLTTSSRNALVFLASHSAVVYDYEHRTQMILQGHTNLITTCAVSKDKRWIVTADVGEDCLIVVWDAYKGTPVKTIFNPHPTGVVSVDISRDSMMIAALTSHYDGQQELCLFAWTKEDGDIAILREPIITSDVQHTVNFDSSKPFELATTGPRSVCFWSWENYRLEGYAAKNPSTHRGCLTCTVYLPDSTSAVSSTDDGHAIVWESSFANVFLEDPSSESKVMRSVSKIIKVSESSISCIEVINEYVAIGCSDGSVKFFDFSLRLEAWFEDVAAGPVTSLSFSLQDASAKDSTSLKFWAPDFIIATSDAFIVGVESTCFHDIQAAQRRGTLLLQGMADDVTAAACHPAEPYLLIACYSGVLQLWHYEEKLLMLLRDFNEDDADGSSRRTSSFSRTRTQNRTPLNKDHVFLRPLCLAYEPDKAFIAVGFSSGIIKFIKVNSLEDMASFAPSTSPIQCLKFSNSGDYLGAYDSSNHVLLFGRSVDSLASSDPTATRKRLSTFEYIGRIHSHSAPIVDIAFGTLDSGEVLISASKDRRICEYDCARSSVTEGLYCRGEGKQENRPLRVELTARPCGLLWVPHEDESKENKFIIVSDHGKMKEYNADTKKCRKVSKCPIFGGVPSVLLVLPQAKKGSEAAAEEELLEPSAQTLDADSFAETAIESGVAGEKEVKSKLSLQNKSDLEYYVYAAESSVIGIGCLPLTGNPELASGVAAHPGRISSLAVSSDGKYVFSCGGADLCVNMWTVNTAYFDKALDLAYGPSVDDRLEPFLNLLEGGRDGPLYNDLIDYFFYFQLRTQGEESMEPRKISNTISVDFIPEIMQAIGLYASQEGRTDMINEIKYSTFVVTGLLTMDVTLEELVKLYVNHRPSEPLVAADIHKAFQIICSRATGGGTEVSWKELRKVLLSEGEPLSIAAMQQCQSILVDPTVAKDIDNRAFDSNSFAATFLGFDDLLQRESSTLFEGSAM